MALDQGAPDIPGIISMTLGHAIGNEVPVGVATAVADSVDLGALMRAADIALDRAKRGGRDRAERSPAEVGTDMKTSQNA